MRYRSFIRGAVYLIIFICLNPTGICSAQAQNPSTDQYSDRPVITFSGGYSFQSVRFLGKTTNARSEMYSLSYRNPLKEYQNGAVLYYIAGVVPYLYYHYPKRDDEFEPAERTGFGISPAGFMIERFPDKLFSPYLRATGGIILLDRKFPTDKSRRLNFTFDISAGGRLRITGHTALSFGYKFHHISNAQTGTENPGLDSNFLYLSLNIN